MSWCCLLLLIDANKPVHECFFSYLEQFAWHSRSSWLFHSRQRLHNIAVFHEKPPRTLPRASCWKRKVCREGEWWTTEWRIDIFEVYAPCATQLTPRTIKPGSKNAERLALSFSTFYASFCFAAQKRCRSSIFESFPFESNAEVAFWSSCYLLCTPTSLAKTRNSQAVPCVSFVCPHVSQSWVFILFLLLNCLPMLFAWI